MEWQPIETAPSGIPVLCFIEAGWIEGMILVDSKWRYLCDGQTSRTPTHWMPLPAPPTN